MSFTAWKHYLCQVQENFEANLYFLRKNGCYFQQEVQKTVYISLFSIFRWWSWQLHENTIFLFINVQYQRRQTWRLYFQKRRYVLQAGLIKVWGFLTNSWRLLRNVMICTFLLGSLGIFASNAKIPEGLALKSLSFIAYLFVIFSSFKFQVI